MPLAIEFTEKNLDVIANSGVISREDVQALYERIVTLLDEQRYFVIDYTDANGNHADWVAPTHEYFNEKFIWTESPKTGFRYCRLK